MSKKALVLMSGGLDSILAAKVLKEQGLSVTGLCFESNFFNCIKAKKACDQLGIELKTVDISADLLSLVKNPPNGHGQNMNPCIDCHGFMIKKAGEIGGYDIIATGEVAGQRPFSQQIPAMKKVAKIGGVEVLRPLSAKLMPETSYEKKGLVDRSKLLDIEGRDRNRQMELAKKYGITEYPSPAGGCLLTDPDFSKRLRLMLAYWEKCDANDVELLKHGRVHWAKLSNGKRVLIVVGRSEEDNLAISQTAKPNDYIMELKDVTGPVTIIRGLEMKDYDSEIPMEMPEELDVEELRLEEDKDPEEILFVSAILTGFHSAKAKGKEVAVTVKKI